MELPGHFCKILTGFGHRFCNLFDDFGEIYLRQMQSFMFLFTVLGAIFVDGAKRGGGVGRSPLDVYISEVGG